MFTDTGEVVSVFKPINVGIISIHVHVIQGVSFMDRQMTLYIHTMMIAIARDVSVGVSSACGR